MSATAEFEIRSLTEMADFQSCVEIQGTVWGYDDNDIIPRRMFLLASKIGGQVMGAFAATGEMAGFAMALPAIRDGETYLHSHMLAVVPQYRNAGVGRRLKLAQRDEALSRGIERMEWTYDPLEIKNAHLNLTRLGAISRRYQQNFYGPTSSLLQGGLPTDRLYAEWYLRSARVEAALEGRTMAVEAVERVVVPAAIGEWKRDSEMRHHAAALQQANRVALEAAFARGLAAIGYERDATGDGVFLLGRQDDR